LAPQAKRVHHVEGIGNAYRAALDLTSTPHFFLVDGDNWIIDGFHFIPPVEIARAEVWMWRTRNAVNGLEMVNGSVKLVSRAAVFSVDRAALDFSRSMAGRQRVIDVVASETRFNSSPFLAWRAGFRECAKLANGLIDSPHVPELMKVWQTVGTHMPNGRWCMLGARMGAEFGRQFAGTERLNVINDIRRLEKVFELVRESPDAPL
jgi:hypothetical protein